MPDRYQNMDSVDIVQVIALEEDNAQVLSQWARGVVVEEIDPFDADKKYPGLNVQCGDTVKRASLGDCVIKHDDGTFDVMSYLAFAGKYVKV